MIRVIAVIINIIVWQPLIVLMTTYSKKAYSYFFMVIYYWDLNVAIKGQRLIFNSKMSQKQLTPSKPYTRKKIQNFSYGLSDAIGKGYSSQVYKGRNDSNEDPVAIKVIDLKMLKCEINRTLLASEIQILKSMKNVPHVLTLHEVYTTKNNTYIITELCDSDLSKKIKKGLPTNQVYRYMDQFLEGYSYIHEKQLIHRDLKPANLLITYKNELKIADFGFGIKAEEVLRPSKYNVGSPLYMAPQSLKRNQYSYKTDIWAIGVIFFEMLTGDTPWRAKNQKQLLKKIQSEKIEVIVSKHKFLPEVREFLIKTLSFDKGARMTPETLSKYSFYQEKQCRILGQKQMNAMGRQQKFQSIINQGISPKNLPCKSKDNKLTATYDRSDKKLQHKTLFSTQNLSLKNIENFDQKSITSPQIKNPESIQKQDRKYISKLLIAEVHFCRFLYKLLGRIKQSAGKGVFAEIDGDFYISEIFSSFTEIIKHKINKLRSFQGSNFLDVERYEEYKDTSDYKKLIKISKDYYDRYSTELKTYWERSSGSHPNYQVSVQSVYNSIEFVTNKLIEFMHKGDPQAQIQRYNKDIIILDYLITCKQLLTMIVRDGENYDKFAKKSRIQEIVEGSTANITLSLYNKIVERAKNMLEADNVLAY